MKYCSTKYHFFAKVLLTLLLAVVSCVYGWGANIFGTIQNQKKHYTENVSLSDKCTIKGANTVITITGNLDLNYYDLTVSDGATLIVEGNVINPYLITKSSSITVTNASFVIKDNLNGAGKVTVNGNSTFAVFDSFTIYIFKPYGNAADAGHIYVGSSNKDDTYSVETSTAYKNAWNIIAKNASLLPITLNYFIAEQDGTEIAFEWQTASEVNNDFFTIEYSIDGVHFNELRKEDGNGTTSETNDYYATASAEDFSGITYFRLKQTDFNGEYSYSDVVYVTVESADNNLYVFPNPTSDFITISGSFENAMVCDMYGRQVNVNQLSDSYFDVSGLPTGTYYVIATTSNGKKSLPFIKQ